MNIPECIIAALFLFAAFMMMFRLKLALKKPGGSSGGETGCEIGTSKTIGDREIQEDEFGVKESPEGTLAVLADGAGRAYGGKIAARIAVQVFLDMFEDQNAFYNPQYYFRKSFQNANREILNQVEESQGSAAVSAILIKNRKLYYAVAGNVKVAVYRNQELVPVSTGHTIDALAKQKYQEGKLSREEAKALLEENRLYNYVGQDGFTDVEFFDAPITLYGGEYVLLMSDGLYDTVRWKDMEDCLGIRETCQEKAYRMIELVNESGEEGKDNASLVLLKVR